MKTLALISARGGSKRVHKKNIKLFLGAPIIKYSIEAALNSGIFNEVMVSTDDLEIAEISKKYGANFPFLRSELASNDFATTADVILEVIEAYANIGIDFDYICCIYPTAPFVTSDKLLRAYNILTQFNYKSVVPVVRFGFPILRSFHMSNGLVKMNWPEHINTRSQDLEPSFHDAGQFYFIRTDYFKDEKKLFTDQTYGIEMPESEVQDIDNLEDWKIAEIKYTFLLNDKKDI